MPFPFLFRQGSRGEGTGSGAGTAPANKRDARDRREGVLALSSAFLGVIVALPFWLEDRTSQ